MYNNETLCNYWKAYVIVGLIEVLVCLFTWKFCALTALIFGVFGYGTVVRGCAYWLLLESRKNAERQDAYEARCAEEEVLGA